MKLNNIKTGLLLAGLLLLFGNVKAQDNPFKPEWFVSGGCLLYTSPSPRD